MLHTSISIGVGYWYR